MTTIMTTTNQIAQVLPQCIASIVAEYMVIPGLDTAENLEYWARVLFNQSINVCRLYHRLQVTYYDKALCGLKKYASDIDDLYCNLARPSSEILRLQTSSNTVCGTPVAEVFHPPNLFFAYSEYFVRAKGRKSSCEPVGQDLADMIRVMMEVDDTLDRFEIAARTPYTTFNAIYGTEAVVSVHRDNMIKSSERWQWFNLMMINRLHAACEREEYNNQ